MDIRASSTISQCLSKAFRTNSEADSPPILEYLKEFTSVFSKNSFDVLLKPKEWDHAIKIIPRSKASNCKVYALSPSEKKESDTFLKENLETRHIRPSKSPMASLVLFISKLINKIQGAKYFTKLNVHWGFNNVHIKEKDE
jgi:hypothetical protein